MEKSDKIKGWHFDCDGNEIIINKTLIDKIIKNKIFIINWLWGKYL